jgi:asparagine synthase (glutamine-hydrolysing)
MCGINGVITSSKVDSSSMTEKLATMNGLIIHRGPDEDGIYVYNAPLINYRFNYW